MGPEEYERGDLPPQTMSDPMHSNDPKHTAQAAIFLVKTKLKGDARSVAVDSRKRDTTHWALEIRGKHYHLQTDEPELRLLVKPWFQCFPRRFKTGTRLDYENIPEEELEAWSLDVSGLSKRKYVGMTSLQDDVIHDRSK